MFLTNPCSPLSLLNEFVHMQCVKTSTVLSRIRLASDVTHISIHQRKPCRIHPDLSVPTLFTIIMKQYYIAVSIVMIEIYTQCRMCDGKVFELPFAFSQGQRNCLAQQRLAALSQPTNSLADIVIVMRERSSIYSCAKMSFPGTSLGDRHLEWVTQGGISAS